MADSEAPTPPANPPPGYTPAPAEVAFLEGLVKMMAGGYEEIDRYQVELPADLTTLGIGQYYRLISQARGWANRTLSMHSQAAKYLATVSDFAKGKLKYLERLCTIYQRDNHGNETVFPKGMDKDARLAIARLAYQTIQDDADGWAKLESEMRAYRDALRDKHKDLVSSLTDVKAALYALRLQQYIDRDEHRNVPGQENGTVGPTFAGPSAEQDNEQLNALLKGQGS